MRERLGHVLWIGGGTGADKSSVAIALAEVIDEVERHFSPLLSRRA
jgi:adenylylsulfate kinase-like enzyme